MAEEPSSTLTVEVETPETEEEVPFDNSCKTIPTRKGRTKEIGEKDNRAFWLTCICIAILSIFCLIDVFCSRDVMEDSQTLKSFFEIIKYVITTSLGFFFATTVVKKE